MPRDTSKESLILPLQKQMFSLKKNPTSAKGIVFFQNKMFAPFPPPPPRVQAGQYTVEEPGENDVLCGRGGRVNTHIGNINFREIVLQFKPKYLATRCKKIEKAHICAKVVTHVRDAVPAGRFLKRDGKTGLWVEVGDEKARKKAGQALREDAAEIRARGESSFGPSVGSSISSNNGESTVAIQTNQAPDILPVVSLDPEDKTGKSVVAIQTNQAPSILPVIAQKKEGKFGKYAHSSEQLLLDMRHRGNSIRRCGSPPIPLTVKPIAGQEERRSSDGSISMFRDSVNSFSCSVTTDASMLHQGSFIHSNMFDQTSIIRRESNANSCGRRSSCGTFSRVGRRSSILSCTAEIRRMSLLSLTSVEDLRTCNIDVEDMSIGSFSFGKYALNSV